VCIITVYMILPEVVSCLVLIKCLSSQTKSQSDVSTVRHSLNQMPQWSDLSCAQDLNVTPCIDDMFNCDYNEDQIARCDQAGTIVPPGSNRSNLFSCQMIITTSEIRKPKTCFLVLSSANFCLCSLAANTLCQHSPIPSIARDTEWTFHWEHPESELVQQGGWSRQSRF